jgi:hypothetical protein
MIIYVLTSDRHNWLLRGFMHQWHKYCKLPITIAGFTEPNYLLDVNDDYKKYTSFKSIGKFEDYPVDRWSDSIIKLVHETDDEVIMILLEDYWLTRCPNFTALKVAESVVNTDKNILRFDITTDRLYSQRIVDVGAYEDVDLFVADPDVYAVSFQASIWRKESLLQMLVPGETPWQAEMNGTIRYNEIKPQKAIWGTRQWPMRYCIVVNKGVFDKTGTWMYPPRTLSRPDWSELETLGYCEPI